MGPYLIQWRLYNHNLRNENKWSIQYNDYADQHWHVTKKTTDRILYIMIVEAVGDKGVHAVEVDACLYTSPQST
jgi:hypothetical protein